MINNLIISTGSNLGDRLFFLSKAKEELQKHFLLVEESQTFESSAVDYLSQPDFLNQVLHFKVENHEPLEVLKISMDIEKTLGRVRDINKGPRTLDIDLLFWNLENLNTHTLTIPHPRLFTRSFIVFPLMQLKYFETLQSAFSFPETFDNNCWVFE